jgi:hypothetical protein
MEKDQQEHQPPAVAPVVVYQDQGENQVQEAYLHQISDRGHANQATFTDNGNSILSDFLREMPQITEPDNSSSLLNEPQSHHDHHCDPYFEREALRPRPSNPMNFSPAPQPDGYLQSVGLEVNRTQPVWGYGTTRVDGSRVTQFGTEFGLLQPGKVASYPEQSWLDGDMREPVAQVTSGGDQNMHATPSRSPHNGGKDIADEGRSQANTKPETAQRLLPASRDRIIGLLADVCTRETFQKIVSSLCSLEVLDDLLKGFIASVEQAIDSSIHFSSLNMRTVQPELLTMLVASGAIMSSQTDMQSLGYAMEEACRLAILRKVRHGCLEIGQSQTRPIPGQYTFNHPGTGALQSNYDEPAKGDLQFLQAYALQLSAGMWSGNHNKMKYVEAEVLPLITACHTCV